MPMRFLLFSFLICLPFSSHALETDNYLSWGKTLKDSSIHINEFLSGTIESTLKETSDHDKKSCEQMVSIIAEKFESHLVHDNPVENWLFRVLTDEEMYPVDLHYVEESIYREPYRFYIPWFGLAPTIQVNGFYFGTDKLSHFASTGMIYYRIFQKEIRKGTPASAAIRKAIDWGIQDEKTLHGFWASGVFSYSDLEANYQGLRFYQRFCASENSYLKKSAEGFWDLARSPEIAEFINGYWDESYLLSFRKPDNWENVAKILIKEYCPNRLMLSVKERFSYYEKYSALSESQQYLLQLTKLPGPQSFESLCSEN